jgi:polyphosphate kinase
MMSPSLEDAACFINREASWLAFNTRVLEEAEDERNPLLERVNFLAITASNLDEFFEVRVAGLLQQIEEGYNEPGPDGLSPVEERGMIARRTRELVQAQYRCWNGLRSQLQQNGIRILGTGDLDHDALEFVQDYCARQIDPLLTPVTVDPAHPFPRVINKALCLAFLLRRRRRKTDNYFGVVTVPRVLPRLVRLPSRGGTDDYIFLADLVALHAPTMYHGYEIISAAAFRVTRNSNLYVQEEEARNLLESVHAELHNRRRGDVVRLEIDAGAAPELVERISSNFELESWQVFQNDGPVNLSRLFNICEQTPRPDLKYKSFVPRELVLTGKTRNLFDELLTRDVLLHHPFDSYNTVVTFIESAASDPLVKSIKLTLYRTSRESPILQALLEAAQSKEVTVVVELKARFDEDANIRWARNLEDAGVQVFHGLVRLKTHCKMALLVRHDPDGATRRYVHLGTGNYNPETARLYTDLSLLTADEQVTAAVHGVFNFLTAHAERPDYQPLLVAPLDLAEKTLALIEREAQHAAQGRKARITAKMNSLQDKSIIQALYRASQAGVEIELIVRGICSLRPGIRGVSQNIRVRSIVGRFLEHSRIFHFANGGDDEVYIGSADWMPRNLYERVETVFPVRDKQLRRRLLGEILGAYLADTSKARFLNAAGSYTRRSPGRRKKRRKAEHEGVSPAPEMDAQEFLISVAEGKKTLETLQESRPAAPLAALKKVRER